MTYVYIYIYTLPLASGTHGRLPLQTAICFACAASEGFNQNAKIKGPVPGDQKLSMEMVSARIVRHLMRSMSEGLRAFKLGSEHSRAKRVSCNIMLVYLMRAARDSKQSHLLAWFSRTLEVRFKRHAHDYVGSDGAEGSLLGCTFDFMSSALTGRSPSRTTTRAPVIPAAPPRRRESDLTSFAPFRTRHQAAHRTTRCRRHPPTTSDPFCALACRLTLMRLPQ